MLNCKLLFGVLMYDKINYKSNGEDFQFSQKM